MRSIQRLEKSCKNARNKVNSGKVVRFILNPQDRKGVSFNDTGVPYQFLWGNRYEDFKLRVTDVNIGTRVKTGCAFQSLGI